MFVLVFAVWNYYCKQPSRKYWQACPYLELSPTKASVPNGFEPVFCKGESPTVSPIIINIIITLIILRIFKVNIEQ